MTLKFALFVALLHLNTMNIHAEERLRGVSLAMSSMYKMDSGTFMCFDGSASIPFSYVNDDFCDCMGDGSDEPGTSACRNGNFYCENIGHKPISIPSSYVNDGICDCCDGSDEYSGLIQCENTCLIMGKEAREAEEKKRALLMEGIQKRKVLVLEGDSYIKQKQDRLEALRGEISELEMNKKSKEEAKKQKEELERAALKVYTELEREEERIAEGKQRLKDEQESMVVFDSIDTNGDKILNKEELSHYPILDTDNDGDITEAEIQKIFGDLEEISLEHFKSTWKELKQMISWKSIPDIDKKEPVEMENTAASDKIEDEGDHEKENASGETFDLGSIDEHDSDIVNDTPPHIDENENDKYDEATRRFMLEANAARREFEEAESNARNVETEIKDLEDSLGKDYGKDNEFAYMVGQCYEFTDREYTYRLCPFNKVTQKTISGGPEMRLGSWFGWEDEDYKVMLYTDGQSCWNGPDRRTRVELTCGVDTQVGNAQEPNRCEYKLEFFTPAVCLAEMYLSAEEKESEHDEL